MKCVMVVLPVHDEHGVDVVDEVREAEAQVVTDEGAPLRHHLRATRRKY